VQVGHGNVGVNSQSNVNDSNAVILQGNRGGKGNFGANNQSDGSDLTGIIAQYGNGNFALNNQPDVSGDTGLIAQFGKNNVGINTQQDGSTGDTAAIIQVGHGNHAFNMQGDEQTASYTLLPAGSSFPFTWSNIVASGTGQAPTDNSIAVVAQLGNRNTAINSQVGKVIMPDNVTFSGTASLFGIPIQVGTILNNLGVADGLPPL